MACNNPDLLFFSGREFKAPCRKCLGCRKDRSADWTVRCIYEYMYNDQEGCFITLTYGQGSVPCVYDADGNLLGEGDTDVNHVQLFIKRLRDHVWRKHKRRISVLWVNEYGERFLRPHYHLLVFGFTPPADKIVKRCSSYNLYQSYFLDELWYDEDGKSFGFVSFGAISIASVAYCCNYIMSAVVGQDVDYKYLRVNPETGDRFRVKPEKLRGSKRPAIGKRQFLKCPSDIYPKDHLHLEGLTFRPPKYFDKLHKEINEELHSEVLYNRQSMAKELEMKSIRDNPNKLVNREKCLRLRLERANKELL